MWMYDLCDCDWCDIMFGLLHLCPNKEKRKKTQNKIKEYKRNRIKPSLLFTTLTYVRNRLVTELVILKVCNVKLSFNI